MKSKAFAILIILLILSIGFYFQINKPSTEFDEGVYVTVFNLVRNGFTLYEEIFYSQLPGFFVLTYPLFLLFGHTLEAARLSIFLWSLVGLLAGLWFTYELGNILVGFLGIGILYLIPVYVRETSNFHPDILASSLSMLVLASMASFLKRKKILWFILSIVFLTVGIITKLDVISIPVIVFMVFYVSKKSFVVKKLFFHALITFLATGFLFLFQFNFLGMIKNVIAQRLQAYSVYHFDPLKIFRYIIAEQEFFMICIIGFLSVFFLKKNLIAKLLIIWSLTGILVLIFYRPLFIHHLVFLILPVSFLAAFSIIKITELVFNKNIVRAVVITILLYGILSYAFKSSNIPQSILNSDQETAANIINKYTNKKDWVVSDDGLLNAISGRLPPPELSELSFVRIQSGNLTPEMLSFYLFEYKPRLIFSWSGRLSQIDNFPKVMEDYDFLMVLDKAHTVFIRR